ncbi:MAG: hypothetical protein RL338_1129 [Chloroflexota bacterium]
MREAPFVGGPVLLPHPIHARRRSARAAASPSPSRPPAWRRLVARALALSLLLPAALPAPALALDPTTVTLTSSANPSIAGASLTLSATVAAGPGSTTPTGNVSIVNGSATLGTCALASGSCSIVASLPVGVHDLVARYPGSGTHDPSSSAPVTQTVTIGVRGSAAVGTTASTGATTLTVPVPAGTTLGDVLVASVSVAGGSGTTIGAAGWTRLTGSDTANGTALRAGLYWRARTSGDTATSYAFTFSPAQKGSAIVVAVAGAVAVAPVAGAATFTGSSVTTPALALGGTAQSGLSLAFAGLGLGTTLSSVSNGYTRLAAIAASGGKASTQTTSGAGRSGILAGTSVTGGTLTFGASGSGVGQTVFLRQVAGATATRVTASAVTSSFGTPVTYGAQVLPATASGFVTLFADGSRNLGTCQLVGGACTVAAVTLGSGNHTVVASYTGDGGSNLPSTSSPLESTVTRAPTVTTLVSGANPAERGSSIPLVVSVSTADAFPATGGAIVRSGATTLGSCTLGTSGPGRCAVTLAGTLPVGTHDLVASYGGTADLDYSESPPLAQVVVRATSSTTLAVTPNPAGFGTPVTITATVTSAGGTPTGAVAIVDGSTGLGSCQLSVVGPAGSCTIVASGLAIGPHAIGASYGGDGDRAPSVASPVALTVDRASSTVTVTGTPNPATFGTSVTLRATVATGDGSIATGSIAFSDGTTGIGTCPLGATNPAACQISISNLSVGDHGIVARYAGDARHLPGQGTLVQTIGRAPVTVRLVSSANPSAYGAPVAFTTSVTSGAGTPTGRVVVADGTTGLGFCDLTAGGACSVTTSALQGGSRTIVATYAGDALRAGGSTTLAQTVTRTTTTTSLAFAANGTLTYGNTVTLTATVNVTAATGTVTFLDASVPIGSCQLGSLAPGACALTIGLPAGSRSIVASYAGDTNHAGSISSVIAATIARATTTTALAVAGGGSYGSPISFTATVTPASSTGTVTFASGGTVIGTCVLGETTAGTCRLTRNDLPVGSYAVTATYPGDPNHVGSASASVATEVAILATTTAIAVSANPAGLGQPVAIAATVTPASPGTVTFLDGVETVGTCTLQNGGCSISVSTLALGEHALVAWFPGDANRTGSSSDPLPLVVKEASSVSIGSSPNPSVFGAPVDVTVTVSTGDGIPATGTVALSDGTTSLGSCSLPGSDPANACVITVASLSAGARTLVARYGGDATHAPSVGSTTQTVAKAGTTTALSSSPNPSTYGGTVTFTVRVTTADGSVASGAVAVSDGGVALARCTLVAGRCDITTSTLAGGTHPLLATYEGGPNHLGSSGSLAHVVNLLVSSVAASASPTSTSYGSPIVFTATVSPSAATGSVSFVDGAVTYGSCTVGSGGPGACTFTSSAVLAGSRSVSVRYSGDTRYAASQTAVAVTVAKVASATTLSASSTDATFGSSVVLTARVDRSTATGTVTFLDGATTVGTCSMTGASGGACTLATSTLPVGARSLTARYAGDNNLDPSTSAPVAVTIRPAPTTTTVTSSANPSVFGSGTLTVRVTPAGATGTVGISDGGVAIGSCVLSAGACSIPMAAWSVGTHEIVASYPGGTNYAASTSAPFAQVVSVGFRSAAAGNTGSKAGTSLAIAAPAGIAAGDVLVAAVTIASSSISIAPPAGWTRLGSDVVSTTAPLTQGLFWRTAPAGALGSSTWTFSGAVKGSGVIIALTGASSELPTADAYRGQLNSSAVPQIYTPGLTLAAERRGIALVFGGMATGTTLASAGTGYTIPASGGSSASSGGRADSQTTTGAAYSTVALRSFVVSSQLNTGSSVGAVNIGHTVFIAEFAPAP